MKKFILILFVSMLILNSGCNKQKTSVEIPQSNHAMAQNFEVSSFVSEFSNLKPTELEPYKQVKDRSFIQKYIINIDDDQIIRGKDGLLIHLPRGCFVNSKGRKVSGEVEVHLIEAIDAEQYAALDLETKSKGKVIECDGMYYLAAYQNKRALNISDDTFVNLRIPKSSHESKLFRAMIENGKVEWKKEKTLREKSNSGESIQSNPVFEPKYSDEFLAYECYHLLSQQLNPATDQFIDKLKLLHKNAQLNSKYIFNSEAEIFHAHSSISNLEMSSDKIILRNSSLFTRDKEIAKSAERLSGEKMKMIHIRKPIILTKKESFFYDLAPVIPVIEGIQSISKKYRYFLESRYTFLQLENKINEIENIFQTARHFNDETEIVEWVESIKDFNEDPRYLRYENDYYMSKKALYQFIYDFEHIDLATTNALIEKNSFAHSKLNAKFIKVSRLYPLLKEFKIDLVNLRNENGGLTRNKLAIYKVVSESKPFIHSYLKAKSDPKPVQIEYFLYDGRFYVSKELVNVLLNRYAQSKLSNNNSQVIKTILDLYPQKELNSKLLSRDFIDFSLLVVNVDYSDREAERLIRLDNEKMISESRNAFLDSLDIENIKDEYSDAYFYHQLTETGWYMMGHNYHKPLGIVQGYIFGAESGKEMNVHLLSKESKIHLKTQADSCIFRCSYPINEKCTVLAFNETVSGSHDLEPENKSIREEEILVSKSFSSNR